LEFEDCEEKEKLKREGIKLERRQREKKDTHKIMKNTQMRKRETWKNRYIEMRKTNAGEKN